MIQIFERLLLIIISLLDIRLPQVIATRRRMKAFGYEYEAITRYIFGAEIYSALIQVLITI